MGKRKSALSSDVQEFIIENQRNYRNTTELSKILGIPRTAIANVIRSMHIRKEQDFLSLEIFNLLHQFLLGLEKLFTVSRSS